VLHLIERIVSRLGLRIDESSPYADADFRTARGSIRLYKYQLYRVRSLTRPLADQSIPNGPWSSDRGPFSADAHALAVWNRARTLQAGYVPRVVNSKNSRRPRRVDKPSP